MENNTSNAMHYVDDYLDAMDYAANYRKWILDCFGPYLGNRTAEVGAGTGGFSRFLLDANIKTLDCYEPSDMFGTLQERMSKDERVTCINSVFAFDSGIEKYDSIVYVNVLEHIKDDSKELHKVYGMLKSGGHALVFVPALQFLYSNHDRGIGHYRRYTRKSLLNIAQEASFKTVFCHWFDSMGILPWYIKFVLFKGRMDTGQGEGKLLAAIYDKAVVPVERAAESIVPPLLGKNVIYVGRK